MKRILRSLPATLMLGAMLVFASCNNMPSSPGNGGDGNGGNPSDTTDTTGNGDNNGPLITNLSAVSGSGYELDTLTVGTKQYIDRDYTFLEVPSAYDGATYIRTANDDKSNSETSFLTFDLVREATVAVLYDKTRSLPSWLSDANGWVDTGVDVKAEGYKASIPYFGRIYEKTFSAGSVELPGNGSSNEGSMYSVAVTEGQALGEGDGGDGNPPPPTVTLPGPEVGEFYSNGNTLFVSTGGSDETGDGSQSNPFATVKKAANEASRGATIKIEAGTYNGDDAGLAITKSNLHFVGINGRPHMKLQASDRPTYSKGVWVITPKADSTTIENIEFSGAEISQSDGNNGAGLRITGAQDLKIMNSYFHDNQDGILSKVPETSHILVENCEFARNGAGDGQSHGVYFSGSGILTFRYNYVHDVDNGNIVKSRMHLSYILYNKIIDGDDSNYAGNYNIDIPDAGVAYVIGNIIEKASYSGNNRNHQLLEYGIEQLHNYSENRLYVINNTFVNNYSAGKFLAVSPKHNPEVVSRNNIFTGTGRVDDGFSFITSDHNFKGDPGYANASNFDYHLTSSSSDAVNKGVDPGDSVYGFDLTPMMEYVQDADSQQRMVNGSAIDLGAFEF